jgi:hypothetical protein
MEAAACGTPSAALAVGGLPESIVDGQTGVLAHDRDELVERTREVMSDHARRQALGDAAYARAREFTWDATARRTLGILHAERARALGEAGATAGAGASGNGAAPAGAGASANGAAPTRASSARSAAAGVAAAAAARKGGVLLPVAAGLLAATVLRLARNSQ